MSLEIPSEFLEQQKAIPKKGGPYKKEDRQKRLDEVYRLHFELGYSSAKISSMMRINRKTISSDINLWYRKLGQEWHYMNTDSLFMRQLRRFEEQRQGLILMKKQDKSFAESLALEKMIFDIDYKIISFLAKSNWGDQMVNQELVRTLNEYSKKARLGTTWSTKADIIRTSAQTMEKINQLIKEDRAALEFWTH